MTLTGVAAIFLAMLGRFALALTTATLALSAFTGSAVAAENPDRDAVIIGTVLVAIGAMLLLFLVFAVKWLLGLVKTPPPEADVHEHH